MGIGYTPVQLVQLAQSVGLPQSSAIKAAAIALRESQGNPNLYYVGQRSEGGAQPESSWGLWQINVKDAPERLAALGISTPQGLLDPQVNARAMAMLWAGNDDNFARHWYINWAGTPYGYAEKYEENLQLVLNAMGAGSAIYAGAGPNPTGGGGSTAIDVASVLNPAFLAISEAVGNPGLFSGWSDGDKLVAAGLVAAVLLV
jgi:hypothetical protein